jgi:serine/threonine-protein kinase
MTPERYQRLCDLFDEVLHKSGADRQQVLERAYAADPSLRADMEAFLAHDEAARQQGFLEAAAKAAPSGPAASAGTDRSHATRPHRPERPKIALVVGSGSPSSGEIQTLLHRRLRLASLVAVVGFTAFLVHDLWSAWFNREEGVPDSALWLTWAALVIFAVVLWGRRSFTMSSLRVVELLFYGTGVAFAAFFQYDLFAAKSRQEWTATFNGHDVLDLAVEGCMLRWFILLMVYGIYIPNTWRRCIVVLSLLALCPILAAVAAAWRCHNLEPLQRQLPQMALWLGVGLTLAVYSTHRISELRQQARQARKLGQYQLKECLGRGGMGEVYLAEHVLLRRPCAIKLIRPEKAGDPNVLLRFEREVQATAMLSHPNTVEIFDYGHAEDGTFYYAMEYLPGLTLQELVDRHGPMLPERAVALLRQLCSALREAHAAGLIHRDIKPSNIIVCQRGGMADVAKLLDFGLVRQVGLGSPDATLTQEGCLAGTPAYMASEQAAGKFNLDARSDIYSLGAVAYFLLTGQPPFPRATGMQTIVAHIYEAVVPLTDRRPDVPVDLQDVVLRCLHKEPGQRFQDAEALNQALAHCQCAGRWTEQQAAAWWHEHSVQAKQA